MNDLVGTGEVALPAGNAEDAERRRLLWLRLLQRQMEKYTHEESSSVPLETAGSLLRCILYTAALKQNGDIGDEKEPEALYEEGRGILLRQFKKAQRLMYLVQSTMLPVDAPCYREAIEMGIPGFSVPMTWNSRHRIHRVILITPPAFPVPKRGLPGCFTSWKPCTGKTYFAAASL